jgi:Zn-dependent protease
MQNHWSLGMWGRIPVTMDWTVLMAFPWLYLMMNSFIGAAIGSVAFFALLVAHEYGHVIAARWRRVPVHAISFNGLHGQTERSYAGSLKDEAIIAWAGVTAQLLVLVLAWALIPALLHTTTSPLVWIIAGPILDVWTRWNVFLIIIALLPIGPMDGHAAWKVIPLLRSSLSRRNRYADKVVKLSAAKKRSLEQDSAQKVTDIIDRLKRK